MRVSLANSPNGALTCFHAWPSASSVPWLSLSAWAHGLGIDHLGHHPAVRDVRVVETRQGEHRRPEIGVIRPERGALAQVLDPGPDDPDPGRGDLGLDPAMVPGERLVRGGAVLGRKTQAVGPVVVVKSHGVVDDAFRK